MLKGFRNILVKELKELMRDPKIFLGMIIVPLIMFPVLGSIMSFSMQTAQEQAQKASVLVLNNDGGNFSAILISNLSATVKVFVENATSPEEALSRNLLSYYNSTQFIEIPSGFSAKMGEHLAGNKSVKASVMIYSVFSGSGMFEDLGS